MTMKIFEVKNHVPLYSWMGMESPDEWETLEIFKVVTTLPWMFHHAALMADGHRGPSPANTVGSVVAMKSAISPAIVGVDIGCGMAAIMLNLMATDLPDSLAELRSMLEERIPVGFNSHVSVKKAVDTLDNKGLWENFNNLDPRVHKLISKARHQCGTLGGGNHFFELCLDTEDHVWLMLHSGSRNIGKELADIHIAAAKKLVHNQGLPDPALAVVLAGTPEFEAYVNDLHWAQEYAFLNRKVMIELGFGAIKHYFGERGKVVEKGETILCHHNYAALEVHFGEQVYVTRKGAINASKGTMGIIPGSMGTKSFIVRGLGNPDSFNSASHGAGRRMSRGAAKKSFSIEDLATQTEGVECRKDRGVLDEIPGAYKNIEDIILLQSDLVEVVAELKGILCIKG